MKILGDLFLTVGNFFLELAGGGAQTANRTLTIDMGNADRTITFTGDVSLPQSVGTGDVTAGSNLTDNAIVRGDGGVKGVQDSTATISDAGALAVALTDAAGTTPIATFTVTTDLTTSRAAGLEINAKSTGTAGDGFGVIVQFKLETTTTEDVLAGYIESSWATATHASRKGQMHFHVYSVGTAKECVALGISGTAAAIGFLGTAAAAQQTGDAGTALVTFGLMSGTPTFAGANVTGTVPAATSAGTCTGNSATVTVADAGGDTTTWVLLGTSQTGSLAPATDAGLTYNAGTNTLTANVTGDVSGSSGSCTGNAATATALATGRTIGGVSFDGTANIVPTTIAVTDTTDTTCSVALFESATGDLLPKTDAGLTYNANTGLLGATALPNFVAAGASAAKGAVPVPGATAHTNRPYYLGDDAAWHLRSGELIAASFVTTSESTTSTSAVDLTTTQHLTFDLDETSSLFIQVSSTHSNTGANVNRLIVDIDGSDTTLAATAVTAASTNNVMAHSMTVSGLASGSHTIKLQFSTNAGTASFFNRTITVWRLA